MYATVPPDGTDSSEKRCWPSKDARNAGMAKVMADDRMKPSDDMPFGMKRMIFGGFDIVVNTNAG